MNSTPPVPPDPIARLEARVRWLTALSTFLSIAFLVLLAWEFVPRPQVLEAHEFVLRDAQWQRRAEFGFRDDGSPGIKLFNEQGRTRVALYLPADGAATLKLADPSGVDRARLALRPDGSPALMLGRADGTTSVIASADEGGRPRIQMNLDGKPVWLAP